jgi:hypothetical protein
MHRRSILKYLPGLEPLEAKQLLSAGSHPLATASHSISTDAVKPLHGFLPYRITNPDRFNNHLTGPFGHVLVQSAQPVPGHVYNVLYVAMRNGTAQTFTAKDGFLVGFPLEHKRFPILRGNEEWKPGQEFIFYVLTKKYYPVPSQISSGFTFVLGGAWSVAIPGPSGIYLRATYNPAKFPRLLDWIVTHGAGAQGGIGIKYGLPDTAINQTVSAKTNRNDFGGYF